MAFHDVRLPEDIEQGALGGPRLKTTILPLESGHEKRNIDWEKDRGRWDISYGLQPRSGIVTVLNFWYARWGRAHTFPFKNWNDYNVGVDATDTYQQIGTGDNAETDFQIYQRYTDGVYYFDKDITKPVTGTTRVFLDAAEQFAGWTVARLTGIVSFAVPPLVGVEVNVICEFDLPVRFDATAEDNLDALDIATTNFDALSIPSIPIIEVKVD